MQDLKLELENQYKLLCFEDLADYYGAHHRIFHLFKKHHKTEFQSNQRFVFYSSQRPGQNIVDHIQRASASIDIGNFFILLVSPYDITAEVEHAQQLHRPGDMPLGFVRRNIHNTKHIPDPKFFTNMDTMCIFPFSQVFVDQIGGLAPCCKFKEPIGNINSSTTYELFHGDRMSKLRDDLANGIKPAECNICWQSEAAGTSSLRVHGLNKHIDELDNNWFDNPQIKGVTINPSTLCNFKCRVCDPKSSTAIATEEFIHTADAAYRQQLKKYIGISNAVHNSTLLNDAIDSPDLEYLHILGGEPFKWPGLKSLLDKAVELGVAKNVKLEFNSNGSVYPEELIDTLLEFQSIEILLSIDDIGKRFEIQRGGVWSEVFDNIKRFKSLSSTRFTVKFGVTVNIQNLLYLDQLVEFSQSLGIEIMWWYLEDPKYLCIDYVTQRVKDLVYEKYHQHPEKELRAIANRITKNQPKNGKLFLEYTNTLDTRRQQNFAEYHSEIFDAMRFDSPSNDI